MQNFRAEAWAPLQSVTRRPGCPGGSKSVSEHCSKQAAECTVVRQALGMCGGSKGQPFLAATCVQGCEVLPHCQGSPLAWRHLARAFSLKQAETLRVSVVLLPAQGRKQMHSLTFCVLAWNQTLCQYSAMTAMVVRITSEQRHPVT